MDFDERTYELIERYLNGELKGQELADFEARIESIPQLKEEININKELLAHFNEGHTVEDSDKDLGNFFKSREADDFRKKLDVALENSKKGAITKNIKEAKVKRMGWKPLAIAASVLLLLGMFFLIPNMNSASPEDLYAYHTGHDNLNLVQKGVDQVYISEIQKAFNSKDYNLAGQLLQPVLDTLSSNSPYWFDLNLASGLSFMQTGKEVKAEAIFKSLKESDFIDAPKATWHYVLALLKQGKGEEAKNEIQSYLKTGQSYKADKMKEILGDL